MAISKVIFHIGLHKTATTFLQDDYFPSICSKNGYLYNPQNIIFLLDKAYKKGFNNCFDEIAQIKRIFSNTSGVILISDECLSGNSWESFNYFDSSICFLKDICLNVNFEILIVLRNQRNLLESLYRHALKHYESISFSKFINYRNGNFQKSKENIRNVSPRNVDLEKFHFDNILLRIKNHSGIAPIVFFYEDLKYYPEIFFADLDKFFKSNSQYLHTFYKKRKVSINNADIFLVRCLGEVLFWNHINYPWKKGNYFGFIKRKIFNALLPFLNFFTSSIGFRNKSFIKKSLSDQIQSKFNHSNSRLEIPNRIAHYYFDK